MIGSKDLKRIRQTANKIRKEDKFEYETGLEPKLKTEVKRKPIINHPSTGHPKYKLTEDQKYSPYLRLSTDIKKYNLSPPSRKISRNLSPKRIHSPRIIPIPKRGHSPLKKVNKKLFSCCLADDGSNNPGF